MNALRLRSLLLASLAGTTLATAALAHAERTFPDSNFAITVPNSWIDLKSPVTTPNMVMLYSDPARKRTIGILVDRAKFQTSELNSIAAFAFEKTMELASHGTKLSGRFLTVQGIKSYEFSEVTHPKDKDIYIFMRAVPVRGANYILQAMRFNGGKVEDDPEILRALDSFRFLKPPDPLPSHNEVVGAYNQAITRTLLPAMAIIAIVVIAIARSRSSPSHSPPSHPPMPPPLPKAPQTPPPLPK